MGTNTNRYSRKLLSEKCKLCLLKSKSNYTNECNFNESQREAHLFPLFNPVGFNSQQMFIPKTSCYKFPASISVSKCAFQGSKLLHQPLLPPPPPKPSFPLSPANSFSVCQAVLPLALLIHEFSSGALFPLSLNFSSLLGLFDPYHLQDNTRSASKCLSQTLHSAMSVFLFDSYYASIGISRIFLLFFLNMLGYSSSKTQPAHRASSLPGLKP